MDCESFAHNALIFSRKLEDRVLNFSTLAVMTYRTHRWFTAPAIHHSNFNRICVSVKKCVGNFSALPRWRKLMNKISYKFKIRAVNGGKGFQALLGLCMICRQKRG